MEHVRVGDHDLASCGSRRGARAACRRRRSAAARRARSARAPGPGRAPWSGRGRARAPGAVAAERVEHGQVEGQRLARRGPGRDHERPARRGRRRPRPGATTGRRRRGRAARRATSGCRSGGNGATVGGAGVDGGLGDEPLVRCGRLRGARPTAGSRGRRPRPAILGTPVIRVLPPLRRSRAANRRTNARRASPSSCPRASAPRRSGRSPARWSGCVERGVIDQVLVVDADCADGTAAIARAAGRRGRLRVRADAAFGPCSARATRCGARCRSCRTRRRLLRRRRLGALRRALRRAARSARCCSSPASSSSRASSGARSAR